MWQVHGMGHSLDPIGRPVATAIPFVNFSVITDPCNDDWFGVTCEPNYAADAMPGAVANMTVTQMWLYSNNLQVGALTRTRTRTRTHQLLHPTHPL